MSSERTVWIENVVLGAVLAMLVCVYAFMPSQKAHAAGGGWDTNGMMAVTTRGNERLVLIDTNKQNMCIYRNLGAGEFRIVGARCYKYDVEVKDSAGTAIEKGNGVTYVEMKKIYESAPKK